MTHRELAYQKICFIKHTDLFRLIFQNVGSTKNTFDSHGSGVKNTFQNQVEYIRLKKGQVLYNRCDLTYISMFRLGTKHFLSVVP